MSLSIYLYDEKVGTLTPAGDGGYSLAYLPQVVDAAGEGAVHLSRSLPVRAEPYAAEEARAYVEGLLPDGMRRERVARELGLDPGDGYGLIAELGRDCPGAITFLPEGETLEPRDPGSLSWLEDDEFEELLAAPPPRLFDPGREERMRFALPGERHKLALVRDEVNDRWAWPAPGAPSTHIVKPETGEYPDLVINEMACMSALRGIGLPIAHAELMTIAGSLCLVSKRFDRWSDEGGTRRLHQESFWQALGFPPGAETAKDQVDRPGFANSCDLLREVGEEKSIDTLFAVGFCNFLLGNRANDIIRRRDLHGRNSALLFGDEGPLLAPFYGISAVDVYDDLPVAMTIVEHCERTSFLMGLTRIGIESRYEFQPALIEGMHLLRKLCQSLNSVADRAKEEGWHSEVIEDILASLFERVNQMRDDIEMVQEKSLEAEGR